MWLITFLYKLEKHTFDYTKVTSIFVYLLTCRATQLSFKLTSCTFCIKLEIQSGHSTHFQVGGDNPKVEGQEFF